MWSNKFALFHIALISEAQTLPVGWLSCDWPVPLCTCLECFCQELGSLQSALHQRCQRLPKLGAVCVQVMRRVHHPNAVQFLGGCTKQEPYLLVTELMSGGSLADAFRSQRVFALRRALEIAVDCARGLAYLHNKKHPSGVVHRDLKPANLMVAGSSYHTRQAFSPLDAVIIVSAWHVSHSCAQMILACAHVTSC